MEIYIRRSGNPLLSLCQKISTLVVSMAATPNLRQRLFHPAECIGLLSGECNQCRQPHRMTQTWGYFWFWIPCVFWLSVLVNGARWIQVCLLLDVVVKWPDKPLAFWMLALALHRWWCIFQVSEGVMQLTHSLGQWGLALQAVLAAVGHSFSAYLFVMYWNTLTCGH